jgi:adenosylhomocysteine nucleosidase
MSSPLLAVVGLKREAALISAPGVVCIAGGGDHEALWGRLRSLDAQSWRAVISVGLAGALSPALTVGDWLIADTVVHRRERFRTDQRLREALKTGAAPLGTAHVGALAGSESMIVSALAKKTLRAAAGALAVDMESHIAARFASEHGLPFGALRVISDGVDRALPKAAQAGMKKDGGMDILAVLRELAKDPRQLPALIRTGREAEIAFGKLKLLGRDDLLGRLGVGDPDFGQLLLDVV